MRRPALLLDDAPRVHDPERIDGALDGPHHVDHIRSDLVDQRLAPRQPDAVLRRHRPAEGDRRGEDLVPDRLGQFGRPRVVMVEELVLLRVLAPREDRVLGTRCGPFEQDGVEEAWRAGGPAPVRNPDCL